jgi:Mor family transcriptional regulator
MTKFHENTLVEDLILSCTEDEVSSGTAQQAIRALCRYYGGQMIYIPVKKEHGTSTENLRQVIADAVGERAAEKILGKIMRYALIHPL